MTIISEMAAPRDDYLKKIAGLDLKGKPVAVFGCGDLQGYGDNFCDVREEMHSTFQKAGAKMLGQVDASGPAGGIEERGGRRVLGFPWTRKRRTTRPRAV